LPRIPNDLHAARGVSFVKVNNGIPDKSITSIVISPEYGTDSTLYVSTWYQGVFRTNDRGKTWERYSRGLTSDPQANTIRFKSPQFRVLRISKTFGKEATVFLGGFDGLFKSTDGGQGWMELETLSTSRIQAVALSPRYKDDSTLAIATFNGGAYISKDQGVTWEVINRGLHNTHLQDIAFSRNFHLDNSIFTISNLSFYKSTSKGENWHRIKLGYSGWRRRILALLSRLGLPRLPLHTDSKKQPVFPVVIAVSPDSKSHNTIYFGTRYQGVFRSIDGGVNWSPVLRTDRWINSLVISPNFLSDKTLYAGIRRHGIYKTVDGGDTWQSIYTTDYRDIYLAVSPYYRIDKTVFATTSEGLIKTIDGGKIWENVGASSYGANAYIGAIGISPNYRNDKRIIISIKRGVFESVNGGISFHPINTNLIENNHAVTRIQFSPAYATDKTIYAASEEELFRSTDGGYNWKVIKVPIRYEDRNGYINYDEHWERLRGEDFSAMTVSHSDFAKSKAMFNFVGTGVKWIGTKSNSQGIAKVYIDGEFKATVDQFSDNREVMVTTYQVTNLPHR